MKNKILLSFLISGIMLLSACGETSKTTNTSLYTPTTVSEPNTQSTATEMITEKSTQKPTEILTEKSTQKPTEIPTEKPTQKPTEILTEKPTEKPTPKATSPQQSNNSKKSNFQTYDNAEQQNTSAYVLNTKTKKVHLPTCNSVRKIAPQNYATTDNLSQALADGYSPCQKCNP